VSNQHIKKEQNQLLDDLAVKAEPECSGGLIYLKGSDEK